MTRPRVVIGLLGTTLDRGAKATRWSRWRPTVSLFEHDDFPIARLELVHDGRSVEIARQITADVLELSPATEVRTHVVAWTDPWDFEEVFAALHDFARAYAFDPDREEYLVHIATGTHVAQICLFLLTESGHFPARLVQTGPGRKDQPHLLSVIDLDLSRYDRIASRFVAERLDDVSFLKAGIETRNESFNRLVDRIEQVAVATKAPLLLMGPTGAGKSALARRIYELKKRRRQVEGAFVEVNCATLRGDGALSALFGHVRGAFTGADRERKGLLRTADGGILFLDEIGELGLDEQAMLLGAIEEHRFLPVGADKEATSDFQLIAGTNQNLRARVASREFREDLLARIDLWTFVLPGLVERREDIEPNLAFELQRHAETTGHRIGFSREARERYLRFATSPGAVWRANFRDLNASLTRLATLARGGRITVGDVDEEIARLVAVWGHDERDDGLGTLLSAASLAELDPFDRPQLAHVVAVCRRSRSLSEAGRALFAVSRAQKSSVNDADRLRKYLARYELTWQAVTA